MAEILDFDNFDFKKTALGYSTDEVDDFLYDFIKRYNDLVKENNDLNDKVMLLKEKIRFQKEQETNIDDFVYNAKKQAIEIEESAKIKAHEILQNIEERLAVLKKECEDEENRLFILKGDYSESKSKIKQILNEELERIETL